MVNKFRNFLIAFFDRLKNVILMTTVSLQRLNEQRLQKLKYRNIKWVTVPSASLKFTPRFGESPISSSRKSCQSEGSSSSMQPSISNNISKTPYFKTSEISFTEPEIQILREADYTNESIPIRKKSSQLEQLQAKKLENDKFIQFSSALSSKSRIQLIPSLDSEISEIPRSDSVVSFKPIELGDEDDSLDNDPSSIQYQNRDSSYNVFNNSSVTIDDIKEHVWMWCHENNDDDLKKKVKHCNAQFIEQEVSSSNPEQYHQQQHQLKYQFQQHRKQRQMIEKQKHHDQEQRQKQQQILQQQSSSDIKNGQFISSQVSFFDESFYSPENRLLEAHYSYTPGERKLRNIIKSHSKIEQDREEVKQRFARKTIPNKNTEKIGGSYCAYKYQKYLFDKIGDVPDFLDEVDFTEAKKVKATLRKNKAKFNSDDSIAITSQRTPRKIPK